jgi:hypothetical protein
MWRERRPPEDREEDAKSWRADGVLAERWGEGSAPSAARARFRWKALDASSRDGVRMGLLSLRVDGCPE